MYKIAKVIPCRKTPHDKEVFDYLVPDNMQIESGDLVTIPFQSSAMLGLVKSIEEQSKLEYPSTKPIHSIFGGIHVPKSLMSLLDDLSVHTCYPKSGILKSWLGTIPKKFMKGNQISPFKQGSQKNHGIKTIWTASPFDQLIDEVKIQAKLSKKLLIIIPWKYQLKRLHDTIPNLKVIDSDSSDTEYASAWLSMLQPDPCLIATTRIGAWMAPLADHCIIYEPENDDHKQDELQPRYDARWILRWCVTNKINQITSIGITPPINNHDQAPTIPANVEVMQASISGKSTLPILQPGTIEAIEEHDGPIAIIHPIHGEQGSIACWDCGWQFLCPLCHARIRRVSTTQAECVSCKEKQPLPLTCPNCQSTKLGKGMPGIDQVRTAWEKYEDKKIDWRTTDNESLSRPFEKNSLVILTIPDMLSGHGEDIKSRERLVIRLRKLAAEIYQSDSTLLIQQKKDEVSPILQTLTSEGFESWRQEEQKQRQLFGYPPFTKMVKLIFDLPASEVMQIIQTWSKSLPTSWKLKGPFEVEMTSKTRRKRQVLQLITPSTVSDKELAIATKPYRQLAIIDLDPISFFR